MKLYYIIARGGRAEYLGVLRVSGGKIEKAITNYILAGSAGSDRWSEVPKEAIEFDPDERYVSEKEASEVFVKYLTKTK